MVAVEPQPDLVAVLRSLYGRDHGVVIEACGVAAAAGRADLHISSRTPTVSTFADSWIDQVSADTQFRRVRWDSSVSVAITTVDELIARYGEPAFCKIDVEGFELEVLQGLTRPLPALSFEYIPVAIERAVSCLTRLGELGDYRFRHSRVETHRWADPRWLSPAAMRAVLYGLRATDRRSGDVYAALQPSKANSG